MFWIKIAGAFKTFFAWIGELAKKLWEGLKKTPKIVLGLIGSLIAVGLFLWTRYRTAKKKAEIAAKISVLEREHSEKVIKEVGDNEVAKEAIKKEFKEKKTALEEEARELEKEFSKGPSGIADAWNKHLESKTK